MVKISVIIPVYNTGSFIRECLDSVLGQTLKDIEVVCVDDGSTDASPSILADYAAHDVRVRVIRQENAGAGAARNRALAEAVGEAVVFMDPDDRYPNSDVLRRMFEALESSGCEMAGGGMRRFPEDNARAAKLNASYRTQSGFPHAGLVTLEEYQSPFRYTCYIYRLAFLRRNGISFPDWRRFQDPPFLAKALIAAGRFWAMEDEVYDYRVSDGPVDWMADDCRRMHEFLKGFDETLDLAEAAGCRKMYALVARSIFRGGRFARLETGHPIWREARARIRRLRQSGWLAIADWAALMGRTRFKGTGLRRIRRMARVVGWGLAFRIWLLEKKEA